MGCCYWVVGWLVVLDSRSDIILDQEVVGPRVDVSWKEELQHSLSVFLRMQVDLLLKNNHPMRNCK